MCDPYKIDELDALAKFNNMYQNCSLIVLMETWLSDLDGFNFICNDFTIENLVRLREAWFCGYQPKLV